MKKQKRSIVIEVSKSIRHRSITENIGVKEEDQLVKVKCLQSSTCTPNYIDIPRQEILPVSKLRKTNLLLPFKEFMKKQDTIRFKKKTAISIYDKYKLNINKKLTINEFQDKTFIHTVKDIDESYFKIVNGRKIRDREPVYKTLKFVLNEYIRTRQEIAYKEDCILNIDVNKINEEKVFESTSRGLTNQANYFDRYISEDYRNSMSLLAKWEKLEQSVEVKMKELQNLANEMFTTKSRLISLDYKYNQQQKSGRFLYYLSPPTWRLHNREFARSVEIEEKGFDFGDSQDEDTFYVIFEKLRNICFAKPIKPVLYFRTPEQLIDVFDGMEKQQLNYFAHVTHLTPYIETLKKNLHLLKDLVNQESASVLNCIKGFQNSLDFYESKCDYLKTKFYNILFGMFYDSVGTTNVLKLRVSLEFCYEKIILDKPMNMDIVSLAKHIENFYMDYSYKLDYIHSETVRRAVSKYQEAEKQKMTRAKHATKELRLFDRLERQLLRAHGFGNKNTKTHENVPRYQSRKDVKKPSDVKSSLTPDELEYLALFTDWHENEDPAKYIQRLSG